MGLPLPPPEIQFIDADGNPYAGGTVETYTPGTTTSKSTWQDEGETILNSNPIVLDAAGRALIWGTGDYRFILRDVNGLLVYDAVTSVVDTSTFATMAQVNSAVQAETNRAEAAEATLQSNINAETTRAEAAENTLTTDLNNEIARAEAAEANLQSQITATQNIQHGATSTDSTGHVRVTYGTAYTSTPSVVATVSSTTFEVISLSLARDTSGFDIWSAQEVTGTNPAPNVGFYWIAVGT